MPYRTCCALGIKPSEAYLEEIQSLELIIAGFMSTLPPVQQLGIASAEDRPILVATHTLAHAAMIHLYQPFASDDPVSYDKCSQAARACGEVITQIMDSDFAFLDPILGVSFHVSPSHL